MTLDELIKHWAALRLAHEGIGVDNAQKASQYARDAAEFARTNQWPSKQPQAAEADMGVSIGNRTTHNHYETKTTTEQTVSKAVEALPSWLKTAALVSAMGVAGTGGALIVNWLTSDPPPVVVQPSEDTDTNAGLRFKE